MAAMVAASPKMEWEQARVYHYYLSFASKNWSNVVCFLKGEGPGHSTWLLLLAHSVSSASAGPPWRVSCRVDLIGRSTARVLAGFSCGPDIYTIGRWRSPTSVLHTA